jgi:fatty acyl-CoA reductase
MFPETFLSTRGCGEIFHAVVLFAVVPAWKEPMPGWVDSLNGPIGLLVGGGKGVIRSMYCKGDYGAQVIPVDMAINGLMVIAWSIGTSQNR